MKKKILKIFSIITSFYALLFIFYTPVKAQTFSLGIYPPLLEVIIKPGKSITQVYKIKNSGEDLILTANIVPFEPKDEFGHIKLTKPLDIEKNWFSLNNANRSLGQPFSLPMGKTEELVLKIKIPTDAKEQDKYFSLVLTTSPTPPGSRTNMRTRVMMSSNILLTISKSGKPRRLAEITQFSTKKFIDSFDQPIFTVKIKNTGEAFFKPKGEITIKDFFGRTAGKLKLLQENILSRSTRQIRCENTDRVGPCQLRNKFLIGRYRSKLSFNVDGEKYQTEIVFYSLPIKITLAFLTILILLISIKSAAGIRIKSE